MRACCVEGVGSLAWVHEEFWRVERGMFQAWKEVRKGEESGRGGGRSNIERRLPQWGRGRERDGA